MSHDELMRALVRLSRTVRDSSKHLIPSAVFPAVDGEVAVMDLMRQAINVNPFEEPPITRILNGFPITPPQT